VTRATATLPRAAASRGRLRGVLFVDTGVGGWANVDAVRESDAFPHTGSLVIPVSKPDGVRVRKPIDLAVPVSD
jgi:hypothetical protein